MPAQTYIVMGALIALFAYVGYRRGGKAEFVTLVTMIISFLFISLRGAALAVIVNRFLQLFLFFAKGGLGADSPSTVMAEARKVTLISDATRPIFLLAIFVFIVTWTYLISNSKMMKGKSSIWSALLGVINGYLLLVLFLPLLPPVLLGPLQSLGQLTLNWDTAQFGVALTPIQGLISQYGSAITIIIAGVIIYMIVRTIQPAKKGG
jgi:hypothetical protein